MMPVEAASPCGQSDSLFTFDVFDTLLTRIWLRPADVFLHAEVLISRTGWGAGASGWSARRRAAEARVRRTTQDHEVTLEQIYAQLAADLGWSPELASCARKVEIECEMQAMRPISPMVRRLDCLVKNHLRVACISDFYMSRPLVCQLLGRAGIAVEAGNVFVSCDEQVTKRTGALFHRVGRHFQLECGKICHTGDHPVSDVQQAKRAGVAVTPYLRSGPSVAELTLASWGDGAQDRLLASAIGGAARRARINRELHGRNEVLWSIATGIAGPLLFGYVYWILFTAREMGIRRLYFLARDGQILLQIARRICAHYALGLDLKYLYASRRAWFLPSMALGSSRDRAHAILSDDTATIAGLLQSLQISPAEVRPTLLQAGFPEEMWTRSVDATRLRQVLSAPPFAPIILERSRQGLESCMEYFRSQGVLDDTPHAIVDIGWKGRLQAALARIQRVANVPNPTGFYLGLRERPDVSAAGPAHVYFDGPAAGMLNPSLVELFSAADHGSTLGYERQPDGKPGPVLGQADAAALDWGIPLLQDGINAFAAEMLDALQVLDEMPARVVAGLRRGALPAVQRLVCRPSLEEAAVLGTFPHAAGQFHQDLTELAPHISIATVLQALWSPAALRGRTHWPQASISRSTPAPRLAGKLWDMRVDGIPRMKRWLRDG
jgi:FMN phosphatase YigB (HAD superfamily)